MIVYTSITNNKDNLKVNQKYGKTKFIVFTDSAPDNCGQWEIRKAYDKFKDSNRNAKIHKILSHLYLPKDHDISVWIDGTLTFINSVEEFVGMHLPKNKDIMFFRHTDRNGVYEEANACLSANNDPIKDLNSQVEYYKSILAYPVQNLLCNCSVIIRRNTKEVEDFNNRWWAEICRFSKRDQISCPIALENSTVSYYLSPHTCTQKYILGSNHKW